MIDSQLRQDIIDEFEFDPAFDGEHIGVAVDNNVVSLTGHVTSYAQKVAAIAAARQWPLGQRASGRNRDRAGKAARERLEDAPACARSPSGEPSVAAAGPASQWGA